MSKSKARHALTNEYLTKNFPDNFSLAMATIESAKNFIHSGKEFTLASLLDHMAKASPQEIEKAKEEIEENDKLAKHEAQLEE